MSHHHHHHTDGTLTFEEKLDKLLDHWIKHNIDHAGNYREWKTRTSDAGMTSVAEQLEKAAVMTEEMNRLFETAREELRKAD